MIRTLTLILLLSLAAVACRGTATACKSNLKNLATALEMYASDHQGHYPPELSFLVSGRYLKTIPTCPSAGTDTYSRSYIRLSDPDNFALCCAGNHHAPSMIAPNNPAYSADQGVISKALDSAQPVGLCLKNLEATGAALERYRTRHRAYPKSLQQLVPNFLPVLPRCSEGDLVMGRLEGRLIVSCPGGAHLEAGLACFQPAWQEGSAHIQRQRLQPQAARPQAALLGAVLPFGFDRFTRELLALLATTGIAAVLLLLQSNLSSR